MPAKMATARPLTKLKSRSPASALSSSRHFVFFGVTGGAADRDGDQAERDAGEDDLPGTAGGDVVHLPVIDRRNECAESRAEAKRDGVTEA